MWNTAKSFRCSILHSNPDTTHNKHPTTTRSMILVFFLGGFNCKIDIQNVMYWLYHMIKETKTPPTVSEQLRQSITDITFITHYHFQFRTSGHLPNSRTLAINWMQTRNYVKQRHCIFIRKFVWRFCLILEGKQDYEKNLQSLLVRRFQSWLKGIICTQIRIGLKQIISFNQVFQVKIFCRTKKHTFFLKALDIIFWVKKVISVLNLQTEADKDFFFFFVKANAMGE